MTHNIIVHITFSTVQSLSHIRFFVIPWTAASQASLSFMDSQSLLKLMSIKSVMDLVEVGDPTISSSIVPFSCLQPSSASWSFQKSVLHIRCHSTGVSMIHYFFKYSATCINLEITIFHEENEEKMKKNGRKKRRKNGNNKIMALINNNKSKQ